METCWKKRTDSKTTDSTMPKVVRMAIDEKTTRITITVDSTRLRARNAGVVLLRAMESPPMATARHKAQSAIFARDCRRA